MSFQASTPGLILASQSAIRQQILTAAGLIFDSRPAHIDEDEIKRSALAEGIDATETAILLAELKAHRIARTNPDAIVIGCDQLLVCDDRWFDKPKDLAEAKSHLQALKGRPHTLVTAILCQKGDQRLWHHIAKPKLTMRNVSDHFLTTYLQAEGQVLTTTVGGYRLEGPGVHLFDKIEGDHTTILGLPLLPLLGYLRQAGVVIV